MLVLFICGSIAQYTLGLRKEQFSNFLSINFGNGLGLAMGVLIGGKISGAHMNPAVSFSMLLLGRLTPLKFVLYQIGQSIGAFVASAVVYFIYKDAINNFDGGMRSVVGPNATAGIWATYPEPYLSTSGAFVDEMFGTSFLVLMILTITDKKNVNLPHQVQAFLIGSALFLINQTFSLNSGAAINPVRDFIPRIFTSIVGYGSDVFKVGNYFFWVPLFSPFVGATISTVVYAIFINNHWPDEEENS